MPAKLLIEEERLRLLRETGLLDTPAEKDFDDIVILAARMSGMPIAFVSLIDGTRQWFKSKIGLEIQETSREISFCTHALEKGEPLIVEDAAKDQRFSHNPLVKSHPGIRFYTGIPLLLKPGLALGTLAVADTKPGLLERDQLDSLVVLSRRVVTEIKLRLELQRKSIQEDILRKISEKLAAAERIQKIAGRVSQLGGWQVELPSYKMTWSEVMKQIHGLGEDYQPNLEEALAFYDGKYREQISSCVEACASEGTAFDIEAEIHTAASEKIWVHVMGESVKDHTGRIVAIQGAFQDISERKSAEIERLRLLARLRERIKEQKALYQITSLLRDSESSLEETLAAVVCEIPPALQYPDLVTASISYGDARVQTDDTSATQWVMAKSFTSDEGKSGRIEVFYQRNPVENSDDPFIPEEESWLISLAELLRSYINRRIGRNALRASEERFRNLFQSIPNVAVQGFESDGTITYWNDAAENFYGYTADEALGKNLFELMLPVDAREEARKRVRDCLKNGVEIPAGEMSLCRKDGSKITVYTSHAIIQRKGRSPELFCVDIDLTKIKQLEKQLLRIQRMESIGTLAGGIAHDLNNLFSPIFMGVDLLRRNNTDEKALMVIDNIAMSASRGADLVKQVLAFARGVEVDRMKIDFPELLREIESIVVNTFPRNISFRKEVQEDVWTIVGDPIQLSQVLLNVCLNARDAMPDGGRLFIAVRNQKIDGTNTMQSLELRMGSYVVIEVSDEGVGIRKEKIERIFEPFYTTKEISKGTGLGLSTTLGIVKSHGGTIDVFSEEGKGSSFKVYLPVEEGDFPIP